MSLLAQPKWVALVSAVLAIGGLLLAGGSLRTAERAKALPRMTCAQLLQKGRAAPPFLTLTDVQLCAGGNAFRRDMDAAMEMYVPVFSSAIGQEPRPADLRLLLEVLDDRERDRLPKQRAVGELAVELFRDASSLDPWAKNTLATLYPGIQLANCRMISIGLHEPSEFRARHEWRDGIAMITLAACCQLAWWIWHRVGKHRDVSARELVGRVGEDRVDF